MRGWRSLRESVGEDDMLGLQSDVTAVAARPVAARRPVGLVKVDARALSRRSAMCWLRLFREDDGCIVRNSKLSGRQARGI